MNISRAGLHYLCSRVLKQVFFMKKRALSVCNRGLLLVMPVALASGIVLECLHGGPLWSKDNAVWTWLHVAFSSALLLLVVWHVALHWKSVGNWYKRYRQHRSRGFRWMAASFLLIVLTGISSVPFWMLHGHAGVGGVHGKIELVCAFFMLEHLVRHRRWYLP